MSEVVLSGQGRQIVALPNGQWEMGLLSAADRIPQRLDFMSAEHHRVRRFVVAELPRVGGPVSPEHISRALSLPIERTRTVLDELEKRLFFLVRNERGAVSWAFPVTVESTGHGLSFSTGERLDAA